MRILLCLSIFLSASGCQALMQDWQRERMLSHLERIENYHGTLVENGILESKEPLVSEVWFRVPHTYYVVVKSPAKYAGSRMFTDGHRLEMYYPQSKFAIVYDHLPALSAEETKKLVEDAFRANLDA
ncbi:MAG: hypothetical protein AAB250_14020, partial [Bdellovibrionota bacterium]